MDICLLRWNLSVPVLSLGQHVQPASRPAACSMPPYFHCHFRRCSRTSATVLLRPASLFVLHHGRPHGVTCHLSGLLAHPASRRWLHHHHHHQRPPSRVNPATPSPPSRGHPHPSCLSAALAEQPCFSTKPSSSPLCQD